MFVIVVKETGPAATLWTYAVRTGRTDGHGQCTCLACNSRM